MELGGLVKLVGGFFDRDTAFLIMCLKGDQCVGHAEAKLPELYAMLANFCDEVDIDFDILKEAARLSSQDKVTLEKICEVIPDEPRN